MEFSKLSAGAQFALIVVLIGGMFIAFYFTIYANLSKQVESKKVEFDDLQQKIREANIRAKKIQRLEEDIKRLKEEFELLKRILPTGRKTKELLQRVRNLAADSNLLLKRFDPAPLVQREMYADYPVHMRVLGSFSNLASFFDKISKLSRIINIYNLDIKSIPRGGLYTIEANFMAVTFVLTEGA